MHDVFRGYLSSIKSTAKSQDIIKWKQLPATKSCYKKLFDESDFPGNLTYMELILEKVWSPTSKPPEQHVAWAISIVQTILNPKNGLIKISDENIRYNLSINIVSIRNFTCKIFRKFTKNFV
jgi:hypothetical protein